MHETNQSGAAEKYEPNSIVPSELGEDRLKEWLADLAYSLEFPIVDDEGNKHPQENVAVTWLERGGKVADVIFTVEAVKDAVEFGKKAFDGIKSRRLLGTTISVKELIKLETEEFADLAKIVAVDIARDAIGIFANIGYSHSPELHQSIIDALRRNGLKEELIPTFADWVIQLPLNYEKQSRGVLEMMMLQAGHETAHVEHLVPFYSIALRALSEGIEPGVNVLNYFARIISSRGGVNLTAMAAKYMPSQAGSIIRTASHILRADIK